MPRVTITELEAKIHKLTTEVKDWRESVEEQRALSQRKFAWAAIEHVLVAYRLAYDSWSDAKGIFSSYLIRVGAHARLAKETLDSGKMEPRGAFNAGSVYEHAKLTADNYAYRLTAVETARTVAITTMQQHAPPLNDDPAVVDKMLAIVGEEAAKKLSGWQTGGVLVQGTATLAGKPL